MAHHNYQGDRAREIYVRYHVDNRNGFVPLRVPLPRLPSSWELWEATLDAARSEKLRHAEQLLLLDGQEKAAEEEKARVWRETVEKMPILPTDNLVGNEMELRRAHHVLAFIVQFYAHTLSLTHPVTIPRSVTIPLLRISKELQQAPFLTYFDHALNNWSLIEARNDAAPIESNNLVSQTTFTGTSDENELYMIDIRLELEGARALEQLRLITEEVTSTREPDAGRITDRLHRAALAIEKATQVLRTTPQLVSPLAFYHDISPWLRGPNLDPSARLWTWEGSEEVEDAAEMLTRTNSPNAGQSPLIPALDAYLGVEEDDSKRAFLNRVLPYMLHGHAEYIQHLRSNGCPLRSFVERMREERGASSPVVAAYNAATGSLTGFRTAHLTIISQYILIPARKAGERAKDRGDRATAPDNVPSTLPNVETMLNKSVDETSREGDPLMKFLKGFRDGTGRASII
ncbi:Indoleamine 2,3-dioxygenase [Coniochaeta sp. 2T2.1]|nr:Indoleamine 2,3-dioxygenase [Coniochaeta sp. 2T2.1]